MAAASARRARLSIRVAFAAGRAARYARRAMDVAGKVALVTGGARIGQAVAQALARRGCALALTYRASRAAAEAAAAAAREAGVRAEVFRADVTDEAQVAAAVASAEQALGRLDILVNLASTYERTPLEGAGAQRSAPRWTPTRAARGCSPCTPRPPCDAPAAGRIVNVSDWLPVSGRPRYRGLHAVLRVEGRRHGAHREPRARAGARHPGERRRPGPDPGAARPHARRGRRGSQGHAARTLGRRGGDRQGGRSSWWRPTSSPASRSGSTAAAISREVLHDHPCRDLRPGRRRHRLAAARHRRLRARAGARAQRREPRRRRRAARPAPGRASSAASSDSRSSTRASRPTAPAPGVRDRRARDDAAGGGDRRAAPRDARGHPPPARRGLKVAALTNNWITEDGGTGPAAPALRRLHRVGGGRAAQARPAHLPARLPRARRDARRRRCSSTTSAAT